MTIHSIVSRVTAALGLKVFGGHVMRLEVQNVDQRPDTRDADPSPQRDVTSMCLDSLLT